MKTNEIYASLVNVLTIIVRMFHFLLIYFFAKILCNSKVIKALSFMIAYSFL